LRKLRKKIKNLEKKNEKYESGKKMNEKKVNIFVKLG